MFYSNLKPNLCHEIILTTGFHSLIIDLSDDVFFNTFYRHFLSLTEISEIETVDIRPKNK